MADAGLKYLGRVLRIISPTRLLINIGKNDISVGDKIYVFEPCDLIFDHQNLVGAYEKVKDVLEVIHCTDNYSECAKLREVEINPFQISNSAFSNKKVSEEVRLNVLEEDIERIERQPSSTIKVGDYINKY